MAEVDGSIPSLVGLRVAVTRARTQAAPLVEAIEQRGGIAIGLPLLEIIDAEDAGTALTAALASQQAGDWLVVLSPNGARRIVAATSVCPGTMLAVIARGTGEVFSKAGWAIDLMPEVASSAGLLDAFKDTEIVGRVLIAQAEGGRTELADGLASREVPVEVVAAYRNVMPSIDQDVAMAAADSDVVVFASPSAVERYVATVGEVPAPAVCIGSVTAATAAEAGFTVTTCSAPTVDAIIESLAIFAN